MIMAGARGISEIEAPRAANDRGHGQSDTYIPEQASSPLLHLITRITAGHEVSVACPLPYPNRTIWHHSETGSETDLASR
jgi:hypothetical protein